MKKRLTREALIHYYGSVVERLSLVPPGTPPRLLVPETDTLAPQEATVVGNILVASAEPKEGRTTTAIGLAFAAALLKPNKRILLVDLDLRHSRIHRLLGLENTRGIREVIINKWKLEDVVYRTRLPNLTVIPGGKAAVDFP
ncbi:MAG: tyrosine-protein kinase family protein, partial [Nitrospinota bacterium]